MFRQAQILLVLLGLVVGCHDHGHDHGGHAHDHGHAHEGAHGGNVVELSGHAGHLEIVQDSGAGTVTIYVLGEDAKTPMAGASDLQLKLTGDGGTKVVNLSAASDGTTFTATDDALKGHLHGRVSLQLNGKTYNPDLGHDH